MEETISAVPVPSIPEVHSVQQKSSTKKVLIIIGVVLGICFLCSVFCLGGGYFAVISGVNVLKSEVTNKVCITKSEEIEKIYTDSTTANLKAKYSEGEFAAQIIKLGSKGCDELKNASFYDFISKAWILDSNIKNNQSTLVFRGKLNNADLEITLVGDADGSNYKIDDIEVSE